MNNKLEKLEEKLIVPTFKPTQNRINDRIDVTEIKNLVNIPREQMNAAVGAKNKSVTIGIDSDVTQNKSVTNLENVTTIKRDVTKNKPATAAANVVRPNVTSVPTVTNRENVTQLNLTVTGEPTEIWRDVERPLSFFKDSRRKYKHKIANGKNTLNNKEVLKKLESIIKNLENQ